MIDPGRGCEPGTQAALWQIQDWFVKWIPIVVPLAALVLVALVFLIFAEVV